MAAFPSQDTSPNASQTERLQLFPKIEALETGFLDLDQGHRMYYEISGQAQGQPVLYLHGGPGGGISPKARRYFDPDHYQIIAYDQRGAGKSTPHAELRANTTWDLVADIERLRRHLNIERWLVFGGSWGSTLALVYAITHPERVSGLILRGIFLARPWEVQWLFQEGASYIFPDAYDDYIAPIPASERHNLVDAFYRRLTGADPEERLRAARAWSRWEAAISKLVPDEKMMSDFEEDEFALAFARIEAHYFQHNSFLETDNWILENSAALRHIPGQIVHGRYDIVCPARNAWELHQAWPQAGFHFTPDAGHAGSEPGTLHQLIQATEAFKS